jgi:hypothetical protein
MHDVITSIDGVIDGLLQLFLTSPKTSRNLIPRIVDPQAKMLNALPCEVRQECGRVVAEISTHSST